MERKQSFFLTRTVLNTQESMSTTSISALPFAGQQFIIYSGIPIFIAGVLGGLLNTIVFSSLQTFRQSSCAFYLTIMSILNISVLSMGLLSNIITAIYGVDGTESSLFFCKFRPYFYQVSTVSSLSCFCLATIDQYWATCSYPRLQQWCNTKLAHRLVLIIICTWCIHGIPYWIYFYHTQMPITGKVICTVTNPIYVQYRTYINVFTLSGFLPITIGAFFGLMAYHNVGQIAHRALPVVRRELDKQLTVMVLIQVVVNCFSILPYTTVNIFVLNPNIINDPVYKQRVQMSFAVMLMIFYFSFAVSVN